MSQFEVEEESLYNEPLGPQKRKLAENVEETDEKEAKKAKVEEEEEIDVENDSEVPEVSEEQVVPEIIEILESSLVEVQDESINVPLPEHQFVGEIHVNPDPFQLIDQIRDEDFSDSENDSPPIFYSDSDSSELELDYFEASTIWFEFNSSDNEDWKLK